MAEKIETQAQLEERIFNQLNGLRRTLFDAPDRNTLMERLGAVQDNARSAFFGAVQDGLNSDLVDTASGVEDVFNLSGDAIGSVADHLMRLQWPSSVGEEEARQAAKFAAKKILEERNSTVKGPILDVLSAAWAAFSWSWPPFSLEKFEQALNVAPITREANAYYTAVKTVTGSDSIAREVSKVNEHGQIMDGQLPSHVDYSSQGALQVANYHQNRDPEAAQISTQEYLGKMFKDHPYQGAVAILGTGAATYVATSTTLRFARGFTEGGLKFLHESRTFLGNSAGIGNTVLGNRVSNFLLPDTDGKFHTFVSSFGDDRATGPDKNISRRRATGRFMGNYGVKVGMVAFGAIPLVGMGVSAIGNAMLYDEALEAHKATGKPSSAQLRVLEAVLITETGSSAFGILGDIATQGGIEVTKSLIDDPEVSRFLPPTYKDIVVGLFTKEEGQELLPIERIAKAIEQTRDREDAVFSLTAENPHLNMRQWDTISIANEWLRYVRDYGIDNIASNPYSKNPVIQRLHEQYKYNNRGEATFADYVKNQSYNFSIREEGGQTFLGSLLGGEDTPVKTWDPITNIYVSEAHLLQDLANRGPIYTRLLDYTLAKGGDLGSFDRDVIQTMKILSNNILEPRPGSMIERLAVLPPSLFGGRASNLIKLPTQTEVEAYNASLNQIDKDSQSLYVRMAAQIANDLNNAETKIASAESIFIEVKAAKNEQITRAEIQEALRENPVMHLWRQKNSDQFDRLTTYLRSLENNDTVIDNEKLAEFAAFTQNSEDAKTLYDTTLVSLVEKPNQLKSAITPLVIANSNGEISDADVARQLASTMRGIELSLTLPKNNTGIQDINLKPVIEKANALHAAFAKISQYQGDEITPGHMEFYAALQNMSDATTTYYKHLESQQTARLKEIKQKAIGDQAALTTGDAMTTDKQFLESIAGPTTASYNRAKTISNIQVAGIQTNRTAFAGGTLDVKGILPDCVSGGRDSCAANSKIASEAPVQTADAGSPTDLGLSNLFRA